MRSEPGGEGPLLGAEPRQGELGMGAGSRQVGDPCRKGRYLCEGTAWLMAYFSFPKYSLPVGSGPDVMVVAEDRGGGGGARGRASVEPPSALQRGLISPLASLFRSSIGTSESSTVLGKGCEERVVRSCSHYQITMATDF